MATQETERQKSHDFAYSEQYAPSPVPKPVIAFFAFVRQLFGKPEAKRETIYTPPSVAHEGTWKLCCEVEPDELDGGFVAECLDVPGAMAQGETEQEALENLIDAVQAVVAAKMEESFRSVNFSIEGAVPSDGRKIGVTF